MDKIDKLKALIELSQNDTITPKEVERFLSTVLDFIRKAKDNFESLSKENLQTIQEAIVFIETKKDKLSIELDKTIEAKKKDVNSKIVSDIKDVKGQFSANITEAKKLLKEIKAIKVYKAKDGVDGIDGVSPDPKAIVDEVLSLIPKQEAVTLDEGEEIVEKINELPTDNDKLKIDASHIKNLPEQIKANGGGWRNLYQLHDVNITDPTDGQVLEYDSANQIWKNAFPESQGLLVYMFANSSSDIGGYYDAVSLPSYVVASQGDISTAGVSTTPTLLGTFATELGYPGIVNIPEGVWHVHYETEKVAGSNNYYTYANIYKRSSGGTETLLFTSDNSTQTASNTVVQQTVTIPVSTITTLLTTDRIVVKVYGVMLSSTATIHLYFDDNTDARIELPSVSVDASNFVPYSGATASVDLGSFDLSVADEAYGAGWNGSLEVPTKNAVYDKIQTIASGGITRTITSISSPTTAGATASTDYVYIVTGTTTLTLPTAVGNTNRYTVKQNGSGVVTVDCTGGQTIDGGATAVLTANIKSSIDLISDNSNWLVI